MSFKKEEVPALAIQDLLRPGAGGLIPGFQVGDRIFIPGEPGFDEILDSSGESNDVEFVVLSEEALPPHIHNSHLGRNMTTWGEPVAQVLAVGLVLNGNMWAFGACFVTQKFVDFLRPHVPPVDIDKVVAVRDGKRIAWRTE